MSKLKWYHIVLIIIAIIVVVVILYKLATRYPNTVQFTQNADGTSTSYITTPSQQMIVSHDSNGNTQQVRVQAVTNLGATLPSK